MTPPGARRVAVPADVATVHTLRFVVPSLPRRAGGARVLEVGCGTGALAARLVLAGHRVFALDASRDAVAAARAAGVDAHEARWPAFTPGPGSDAVDAVLFTRALHHLRPLGPSLDRARELLPPGGAVLVEDFAYAEVDARAAAWLHGALALLDGAGALSRPEGAHGTRVLAGRGDLAPWRRDRDHGIAPAAEMRAALAERFELVAERAVPYLYRYALPMLPPDARGAALARRLLAAERRLGAAGAIPLIGRRWVARRAA